MSKRVSLLWCGNRLLLHLVQFLLKLCDAFVLGLNITLGLRVRINRGLLHDGRLHNVDLLVDEAHFRDELIVTHVECHYLLVEGDLVSGGGSCCPDQVRHQF